MLPGRPLPLGVSRTRDGLNFSIFSHHATAMTLVLFASGRHDPVLELPLDPSWNRTGDTWHMELAGLRISARYGWRADRRPVGSDRLHRFDPRHVLLDPYARALSGASVWGMEYVRTG